MPAEVLDVTTKFMREPVRILVKKEELTLEGIKQFYINVEREVRAELDLFKATLMPFGRKTPSFPKHHAKISRPKFSCLVLVVMLVWYILKEGREMTPNRK